MHRVDTPTGLFIDGDEANVGTILRSSEVNTWQEELCYLVETAGITLDPDGNEQVYEAIQALVGDGVGTHAALTAPHSATDAATANRLILRDANGRAKVAAPSASDDIAINSTVTTHVALTNPHSATDAATADRIILRDANGRAKVAAPIASDDIAINSTVTTHAALTNPHSATDAATAGRIILRDANGRAKVANPSNATELVNVQSVVPSLAGMGGSILGAYGIGSLCFAHSVISGIDNGIGYGEMRSGSQVYPTGYRIVQHSVWVDSSSSPVAVGTWRSLGFVWDQDDNGYPATLFIRFE